MFQFIHILGELLFEFKKIRFENILINLFSSVSSRVEEPEVKDDFKCVICWKEVEKSIEKGIKESGKTEDNPI